VPFKIIYELCEQAYRNYDECRFVEKFEVKKDETLDNLDKTILY
jgi:hypothetical protein